MNYRTNKKPPCGPIYFNNFEKREDIIEQFGGTLYESGELTSYMRETNRESVRERSKVEQSLDGAEVLLAWYGPGSYEGAAFVLFQKGEKLFSVNSSHCSCNGLEGSWSPVEVTWRALAGFMKEGATPCLEDNYGCDGERDVALRLLELMTPHVEPELLPVDSKAPSTKLDDDKDEESDGDRIELGNEDDGEVD